MANKLKPNQVYKCIAGSIASASFHVIGGTVTVKGSNVTIAKLYKGNVMTEENLPKDATEGDTYTIIKDKKHVTWYKDQWTEIDVNKLNGLIVPELSELVETGDTLEEGIHLIAGLPEWIAFEGDAIEIWAKAGVDVRFVNSLDGE